MQQYKPAGKQLELGSYRSCSSWEDFHLYLRTSAYKLLKYILYGHQILILEKKRYRDSSKNYVQQLEKFVHYKKVKIALVSSIKKDTY